MNEKIRKKAPRGGVARISLGVGRTDNMVRVVSDTSVVKWYIEERWFENALKLGFAR